MTQREITGIQPDLYGLCSKSQVGRSSPEQNTCFKSAGDAMEGLTLALAIYSEGTN
ncbi:MAG: hypothetical protein OEX02_17075 [Cyclobacteriaceae bacterium]|nr:hypothetical protein [Cyclobacteriaceae bacterium]